MAMLKPVLKLQERAALLLVLKLALKKRLPVWFQLMRRLHSTPAYWQV
jgi:hypothetical protein